MIRVSEHPITILIFEKLLFECSFFFEYSNILIGKKIGTNKDFIRKKINSSKIFSKLHFLSSAIKYEV